MKLLLFVDQELVDVFKEFDLVSFSYEAVGGGSYRNVYVEFKVKLGIAPRGQYLMRLEDVLINKVNPMIRVWHVPIGDKNSLRNLRGVTLK